jgi:hypothetical protein
MANTLTRGYTFGSTELVTNAKLHALVDSGTATVDTFTGILPIANGGTASATQNFVSNNGTVNPTNLLSNGDFESWLAGTDVAPDGWTLTGAGSSVARGATTPSPKLGTYYAELTRAGTNCFLSQAVHGSRGATYYGGRTVTFGCWVYATAANNALLGIDDGVTVTYSSMLHSGTPGWEWLTLTKTLSAVSSTVEARCYSLLDNNVMFDGAILVEGSSVFAYSPKPLDASKEIVADTDESQFSHKLPVDINGTTYYIMLIEDGAPM